MPPNEVREPRPLERARPAEDGSDTNLTNGTSLAAGLQQAIENAAGDWWWDGALLAIRQLALSGRGFTVDHLSSMVGEPPDPHYWGALLAAAQKLRIVEPVGARVGRDGRLVRVWWSAS
jgi:hypothetical protein